MMGRRGRGEEEGGGMNAEKVEEAQIDIVWRI